MTGNLETASWVEVVVVTAVFGGLLAAFWWFTRFWERMWVESLESRSVDRRYLRWQRAAFRGKYPLGHWRKPWSVPYVRFTMSVSRGLILFMAGLYVFFLLRRIFG